MTIFELVTAPEITAYWDTVKTGEPPYLGTEIFPAKKKLGLDLKWIRGSKGLPVVLKLSAFDVKAIPRDRIAFSRIQTEMPFFKESKMIDETLRQQLNIVMESGNQAYIDSIMNRVFDDKIDLLRGAAAQRERMCMQLLTTGSIALASNGQAYTYNYGIPGGNLAIANPLWANAAATIMSDIQTLQDTIENTTGVRPTRAICDRGTWNWILANTQIRQSIMILTGGQGFLTDAVLKDYIQKTLGVNVVVYTKRFINEAGASVPYVPANTFVLLPPSPVGNFWFGTTPEESDLMGSNAAENVSITDVGVAVTAMKQEDPVTVETKVTQICLPSAEGIDYVGIITC